MVRAMVVRGMVVGVVAAALAFAFASVFGEPTIDAAIAFEDHHTAAGVDDPAVVSRPVQSTVGLAVAVLLYGSAIGGIFALAFAFAYGRLGALSARPTSMVVAAGGFVAVYLVPFLKYPATPPAVGQPDTIGRRSVLYLLMVVVCVLSAVAAVMLGRMSAPRLGAWHAALVATGAFLLCVAAAGAVLPGINEVPADFPAMTLWRFRLASVGTQLVLWTALGLVFGALTERVAHRRAAGAPAVPVG